MIFEKLNPDSSLKDFLDEAEKEKKELEESYKESKRQAKERKLKEKKKKGGAQLESKLIEQWADKWCKDNGYPVRKRKRTRYHADNFILPFIIICFLFLNARRDSSTTSFDVII